MPTGTGAAASAHWPLATPAVAGAAGEPALDSRGGVGLAALVAFIFVQLVAPHEWVPPLRVLRPALLAAGVAVAAVVMQRMSRGGAMMPAAREMNLALVLAGWVLVTSPFSYWPGGAIGFFTDVFAKSVAMFWVIVQVIDTPGRYRRFTWAFVLCAVAPALGGIDNYLAGESLAGSQRVTGYVAGLTENPNDLALVMNLVLPLTVALLRSSERAVARLVAAGMIALFIVTIVITFSRGGFITLAVTAVVYLTKLVRQGRAGWAWAVVVTAFFALPLMPGTYVQRIATIGDISADRTGSAQERWHDMGVAAGYIVMHPIVGAGLGQSALAMNEARGEKWVVVHNMYLEYGVELGLPGLAMFVLLLWWSFQNVGWTRRAARRTGDRRLFVAADGLQVSLIAFATAAVFHPSGANSFLFFYLAALALALRRAGAAPRAEGMHDAAA
ncbi:MAG: O-antigen ligase family protein [Candidatus Rokubacteria bacterium]|nr:O-antigen ligase family protein [Candidatus Rokubacteria bacterium]